MPSLVAALAAGRSLIVPVSAAVFALAALAQLASAAGAPPNVLVVIADDLGWGDLSSHGNKQLQTPIVDRLADEGVSFERFYVQPVCAPTRAEFLAGRHHLRVGVTGVSEGRERLDAGVPTIADAFRAAGYATGLFGKWHNGTQPPYHPVCRGFDEFYGFTSGHWGHYYDFWLDHNNRMVLGQGYCADDFTDHAIGFMIAKSDAPFFAVVAFNTPHSPMQVPDRWWNRHAGRKITQQGTDAAREDVDHTRAALAMCENLDWNVGRLLAHLESRGISDNTIVVFFSDNGPNGHRWNAGLRGVKGSTDEGGVRSPLIVRWPKRLSPGTIVHSPACVLDLPPTLASLCGVALAAPEELDGADLSTELVGEAAPASQARTLLSHWNGRVATRRGRHVLDDRGRLYDLVTDPGQTQDVAAREPEIATDLTSAADAWLERFTAKRLGEAQPFTVGHPEHPRAYLPARDADGVGRVVRSNRFPNCTYFTGWSGHNDAVVWDVEVLTPGVYHTEFYLAVPPAAVGGSLVLETSMGATRIALTEATDCEPLGPAMDRVLRQEGPVMNFRSFAGTALKLEAGRQELRVSWDDFSNKGPLLWQLCLERQ
jgi:arylsulfatase A-like enzyme